MKNSDEKLMALVGRGDKKAYQELYCRYATPLYRLTKRMLAGKKADADEVFQEAMVRVWQKAPLFNPEKGKAKSWLYLVVSRHILNQLETKAFKTQNVEEKFNEELAMSNNKSPEDLALEKEKAKKAHKYLNRLPEEMKQAVILRHLEDLSISEISEIAGCPGGTVKSRIFNGLKKLRSFFFKENSHE